MNTLGWIVLAVATVATLSIIAYFLVKKDDEAKKPTTSAAQPKTPIDETKRFTDAEEALVVLNQEATLDSRLTDDQVTAIEALIDLGIETLPLAQAKYPTHELSWEICRMLSHWLPEQVRRYAGLSEAARAEKKSELDAGLTAMRRQLESVKRIIDTGAEMEFDAALNTIHMKFNA
jgi:hypothetical protein